MGILTRTKRQREDFKAILENEEASHQYCLDLANTELDFAKRTEAWKRFEVMMAVVPEGDVNIMNTDASRYSPDGRLELGGGLLMNVESFYIDKFAVSNEDFLAFVQANGYENREFWPEEIYPHVLQFTDLNGFAGPQFWANGMPAEDRLHHPVVGICWYEANAFALWAGKRLPTCAEWQRAGTWPGKGTEIKFPWGSSFDPKVCNTWNSGIGDTVPVYDFDEGSSPNGVYQLSGNVWEWVGTLFECDESDGAQVFMEQPMAEIRGGAFDTYFASQATCQFRSGHSLLKRSHNIGFRCAISVDSLNLPSDPYAFFDEED